jgi:hypothetical protein
MLSSPGILPHRLKRLETAAWRGGAITALTYRHACYRAHKRFREVTDLWMIWNERRQGAVVALNVELAIALFEFGETTKLVERFGSRHEPGATISASERVLAGDLFPNSA